MVMVTTLEARLALRIVAGAVDGWAKSAAESRPAPPGVTCRSARAARLESYLRVRTGIQRNEVDGAIGWLPRTHRVWKTL